MTSDEFRKELLERLRGVEKMVRADLLAQYRADPLLLAAALQRLRDEENDLTGKDAWLETFAGRAAVLYILKSLYVRVLEDQGLLSNRRVRDSGTYQLFRTLFPQLGYAAYLRTVYTEAERVLPELFAPTAVEITEPSEASAAAVWTVWQETSAGGKPRFEFSGELDTRFIGDLYQDLDPDVRERYALLQTPHFIEKFLLDQTLTPALADFPLSDFRIIDPTCGSGHFLLGAFERLFAAWCKELGSDDHARWEAARKSLIAIHGADLNEYACALSRFRLLLAVVRYTGVTDLVQLRQLHMNVITCDSLIPWERLQREMLPGMTDVTWIARYGSGSERARNEEFFGRPFHVVVGNPPYIAVKDKKKREDYRRAWPRSAAGKYSLSAPMTERFLLLPRSGGRTGIIVGSNFSKAEFGRGVIEKVMPEVKLDFIIDTSGASLPGHATPTVLIVSTRAAVSLQAHLTTVVGSRRGGPSELANPESGPVWESISKHYDDLEFENDWISVQAVPQQNVVKHPWSLGSADELEVIRRLENFPRLRALKADAGFAIILGEDEAFVRRYSQALPLREISFGEDVRDWRIRDSGKTVLLPIAIEAPASMIAAGAAIDLWHLRTSLFGRATFSGRTYRDHSANKNWWQVHQVSLSRISEGGARVVIGETAADSHFVYDSSNRIFGHSAPVLTIPGFNEEQYRDVASILNSSILSFWFKARCRIKNGWGEPWELQYVRNSENVLQAPVPYRHESRDSYEMRQRLNGLVVSVLTAIEDEYPSAIFDKYRVDEISSRLAVARERTVSLRNKLVALQEEIDWQLYGAFGLAKNVPLLNADEVPEVERGHRPFEICLARGVVNGGEQSVWFDRHGIAPTIEIPDRYQGDTRTVLEARLALIEGDSIIRSLEHPTYKRRWTFEPWDSMVRGAATTWLLHAIGNVLARAPRMVTADDLLDELRIEPKVRLVGSYAKDGKDVDLSDTVTRLLLHESIPDNPARLFTPAGLTKYVGSQTAYSGSAGVVPNSKPVADGERVDWKRVWRLQEREDAGHDVDVAVPPPFKSGDYAHPNGWRIRGKFNIANERFIVYGEVTPTRYAWGGWTIAERARLSGEAFDLRDREPDDASVQPTVDDPRRCGIQFPLWDKLDELRRTSDPGYEDVKMLAELCGRSCPCDVLDRWRSQGPSRRNGARRAKGKLPPATVDGALRAADTSVDPAALETAAEMIRACGFAGISAAALEPVFSGDPIVTKRAIERLRVDGRIEAFGKGRGTRYRLAQARLV